MSCCGSKRRALRQVTGPARAAPTPAPPSLQRPRPLRHLAGHSLLVKGPATGVAYLFGDRTAALAVDERDVPALLATGRFGVS